jgi:serine O-acetyltransferase
MIKNLKTPVGWYRIAVWLARRHIPIVPRLIDYWVRFVFACWLPHTASVGRRLILGYGGLGIVVHGSAVIGDDVQIDQGVTIGGNATEFGAPVLEQDVYVGAGAKILGPIRIGRGAVIGANAVVLKDVPNNAVVVGVPGRVVRTDIDPATFLFHKRNPHYKDVVSKETLLGPE